MAQHSDAGGDDSKGPPLCETCRKIDFEAMFTSHSCPVRAAYKRDPEAEEKNTHEDTTCVCLDDCDEYDHLNPGCDWGKLPWELSEAVAACSFCTYLYQCQERIGVMRSASDRLDEIARGWKLRLALCHSLDGFGLRQKDDQDVNGKNIVDNECAESARVQDLALMKILYDGSASLAWDDQDIEQHAILRAVSDGNDGLIRHKDAGGGLLARRLNPSAVNYRLMGQWLSLCQSTHIDCIHNLGTIIIPGFQVIDCDTANIVPFASKTAVTEQEQGYVTLSYVWGEAAASESPVVRSSNENGAGCLALPDKLPLVISDTIQVVRRLGFKYLWVDRYCIPQHDAASRHLQIQNMGKIYSCSILTIIAAAGEGPEYGLPGVSSHARIAQLSVQVTPEISLVLYESPKNTIKRSKWNTRGWTYQEGILSRRRLVFTDYMTYFQCQEMHSDEVLSLPIPGLKEDPDNTRVFSFDYESDFGFVFPRSADWLDPETPWQRVDEFSTRKLGYDSDVLDAISGIVEMYALAKPNSDISFFYGLPILRPFDRTASRLWVSSLRNWWEQGLKPDELLPLDEDNVTFQLVNSLLWEDLNACVFKNHVWGRRKLARRPMFPSWAWAGWKSFTTVVATEKYGDDAVFDGLTSIQVLYSGGLLLDWETNNAEIRNISRQGKDPFCLKIRGTVLDVTVTWCDIQGGEEEQEGVRGEWVCTWPPMGDMKKRCLSIHPNALEGETFEDGDEMDLVALILRQRHGLRQSLGRQEIEGLMLRRVTRLFNGQPEQFYERLNLFNFWIDNESDFPWLIKLARETDNIRLC